MRTENGCKSAIFGASKEISFGPGWNSNFLRSMHAKHVCMLNRFSHVQLFAAVWILAHRAPLSIEFSSQEYCSELPCPPPGDLPHPGTEPTSSVSYIGSRVLYYMPHMGRSSLEGEQSFFLFFFFFFTSYPFFPGESAWTEEPGGLQSMGSQSQTRLSNWAQHTYYSLYPFWCCD